MNAGSEHRIPLSVPPIEVLFLARVIEDGSGLVFSSPCRRGKQLSDTALTKVLRSTALAARANVHGFRSTFRTWDSDRTDVAHTLMELSLTHTVGSSIEQEYARSDLIQERCQLMNDWASFLTPATESLVSPD